MRTISSSLSVGLLLGMSAWLAAQNPFAPPQQALPTMSSSGMYTLPTSGMQGTESKPFEREMLALELAKTAAENGSHDLSLETFRRFIESYAALTPTSTPTAPQPTAVQSRVQPGLSSLLTSPVNDPFSSPAMAMRGLQTVVSDSSVLQPRILALFLTWKLSKVDAGKVADTLQQAVLPAQQPKLARMFAFSQPQPGQSTPRTVTTTTTGPNGTTTVRTMTYAPSANLTASAAFSLIQRFRSPAAKQAIGFHLIDWALAANRLDALLPELEKRAQAPEGQEAIPLVVYALRSQAKPDRAGEYIAKMLDSNMLAPPWFESLIHAAMCPLAVDAPTADSQYTDLFAATQTVPIEIAQRVIQAGMKYEAVAIAPYYQHLIRLAIQREDIKWLNSLAPAYIEDLEKIANSATSRTQMSTIVWNEIVSECTRLKLPHMALRALRSVRDSTKQANSTPSPTMDASQVSALVALCQLPLEKRQVFTQALLLDEPIVSSDSFHITFFPESTAPNYFRSSSMQSAADLLQPGQGIQTFSLLDLLLSDAATTGQLDATIDRLFEQIPKGGIFRPRVIRLLCEWLRMRAEIRQQPIPQRVITESQQLKMGDDFTQWYRESQEPVRSALAAHYASRPDSLEAKLVQSLEANASEKEDSSITWTSSDTLQHWLRVTVPEPANSQAFAGYGFQPKRWLVSSEQQLRAGHTSSALMLKYPLQGNYSIHVKVSQSGKDWKDNSFGGIINGTFLEYRGRSQYESRTTLAAVNSRLTSSLNSAFRISDNPEKPEVIDIECAYQDNRVTLAIGGKKLANAEFASHSFPFAGLLPMLPPAQQGSVKFTGSPEIAKSVTLLDNSFSGWSARRYDRLLTNVLQLRPVDQPSAVEDPSPSHLASWKLENGELHSEGTFAATNLEDPNVLVRKTHNCMLYARPLLEGERFEYEVWHDSQTPAATPVLGLTAMMIEEGRIRLHWLPTAREVQLSGIAADNRADDPQAEHLSPAKLNDSQWNQVSLRIEKGRAVLSINGQDVYRRPIPNRNTTEFGWLSIPDAPSVRVRNATLKGNWPSQMPTDLWSN